MNLVLTLGITLLIIALLYLLTRRQQGLAHLPLRPLTSMKALSGQIGQAIESGSRLHLTMGQGSLVSPANPASVSALTILDHLAKDGCASGIPPIITVGDATLLPAAQDSLRRAYADANRQPERSMTGAQFIASETDPYAYAGGVANEIQQHKIISNVMVGRFGPELMIMAEAADRRGIEQVIGSDDPLALAVATAVSDNLLIGEELFAAGAYLSSTPSRRASLQIQDILRWLIAIVILLSLVVQIISG